MSNDRYDDNYGNRRDDYGNRDGGRGYGGGRDDYGGRRGGGGGGRRGGYDDDRSGGGRRDRDEVYSKRVSAGKRTYFFDVKTTRSGEDFFLTITESKRQDGRYLKHKIFLYKEDFGKFVNALHETLNHIKDERLPDYEFENLPDMPVLEIDEDDERGDYDS
jgi:hypothetical protein